MEIKNLSSRTFASCFYTILVIAADTVLGQQQKFRVTPHDLQILEGSDALLRCEVTNQAGQVQWTKDGFALGFSAVILGFPRYSVFGDRAQGVYNLKIYNASMEDDAEYQCQVGPAKFNSAIRANARLTVISPPSSIEIHGYAHNSKVEVRENQDISLTCTVSEAKPAAQIQWFRGNVEFMSDSKVDTDELTTGKRFTTTSRLRLRPSAEDDYTEYSCQAKHKALQPDMPMRATVQLSVLYPPGPPYIEGYTEGETLRRGQSVELVCRSRGGNPPAQLIWYKNGAQVRMAYRTAGRLSENIYIFTAEANDHKARFRCEASNIMSQNPLKTEIDLTVLFAPTHVSIAGPAEARVGDSIQLTCTTAGSNPPAEIRWTVAGRQIRNATSRTVVSPEGGWLTLSNITVLIEPNKRSLVVICHGLNTQVSENVVSTHTINVLYPPSSPIITGYDGSSIIPAGSIQKLLCMSTGGNPLAVLTWYKNDKKINSQTKIGDKSVSAEITILANVTDNQATYRCEAMNSATEIPLFQSTTLSVHFAADTVRIRVEPDQLRPNMEATMFCDSSSSNPPSKLSWWKDGIPVEGINGASQPGLWGGTVSTLELKVNVTQHLNGAVYTCQSTNDALKRSSHEVVSLQVLYAPKFVPPPSSTVVGVEGEPLQITMLANGNPNSIDYIWSKEGIAISASNHNVRVDSKGPILNITKLLREDTGIYTCDATNSEGTATINITIVVEYGITIKAVSENVFADPGEDVTFSCTVDGHPLSKEHVRWERPGYDMSLKTSTAFVNDTSLLTITNADRKDVGNFSCIADNRVANPTIRNVLLIVNFAPEIDKTPQFRRAATGAGELGKLPCRATGSPLPQISWSRNGLELNLNHSWRYTAQTKQIDVLSVDSMLLIERVTPADYGEYECIAQNKLGKVKEMVKLDITSPPDPPLNLSVVNVTHDSITVAWSPGFDGGMKASYRVRYREANSEHYKYQDSLPNSHQLIITGLKMNTHYLFSVVAMNSLGTSKYLPDLTKVMTKAPIASKPASSLGGPPTTISTTIGKTSGMLVLIGIASGTAIVVFNIFVIGCCLHRRSKKRIRRALDSLPAELLEKSEMSNLLIIGIAMAALGLLIVNAALVAWFIVRKRKSEASHQNSKSATIEMYAPSSFNDTVTGETLSSVSEKSDTYSNEEGHLDYLDESSKKSNTTYLVEHSDLPPPRYQKEGTLPILYPTSSAAHTRTLPHPKRSHGLLPDQRSDQLFVPKATYIPSPSPAPPLDGSYYNMNSDRYLSYPPMDYASVGICSTALPVSYIGQTVGGGTLRRNIKGVVPPPDVTHHTTSVAVDLQGNSTSASTQTHNGSFSQQYLSSQSHPPKNLGSVALQPPSHQVSPSTLKQPQGILKDPKRNQSHNTQILDVQSAPGVGSNLISGVYESKPNSLTTFNSTMGYTDSDGHLV